MFEEIVISHLPLIKPIFIAGKTYHSRTYLKVIWNGIETQISPFKGVHQESLFECKSYLENNISTIDQLLNEGLKNKNYIGHKKLFYGYPSLAFGLDLLLWKIFNKQEFPNEVNFSEMFNLSQDIDLDEIKNSAPIKVKFGISWQQEIKTFKKLVRSTNNLFRIDHFSKMNIKKIEEIIAIAGAERIDYIEDCFTNENDLIRFKNSYPIQVAKDFNSNHIPDELFDIYIIKPTLFQGVRTLLNYIEDKQQRKKEIIFSSCYDLSATIDFMFIMIANYKLHRAHGLSPIKLFPVHIMHYQLTQTAVKHA